jgi:hypothetical protein
MQQRKAVVCSVSDPPGLVSQVRVTSLIGSIMLFISSQLLHCVVGVLYIKCKLQVAHR